jgi:hypothetical protein
MPTIIDNRNNIDQTIRIFDNFYSQDLVVNASEFDVIYGYFSSVCETQTIANNFTSALFMVSQATGTSAMDLLSLLQGTGDVVKMNSLMCYYLNSLKSLTCLYGIGVIPKPNQSVARNVVQ